MPDFAKWFIMQADASDIGALLLQRCTDRLVENCYLVKVTIL